MKQTMNLNLDKHKQSLGQKNKYRSCSSPRKYSSAKEDSDIVGYINNPTSEIETDIHRPETIELCDDSIKADLCTESNQEIIDTSDDSILQEMKKKSQRPNDQTRDRDLKKWIRHCRREYAQQTCNTAEKNSQK
ncbi:PREDICTED: uncharacterized protein LOC105368003 [Ceratosolen solmsi marchali]|uniref:Uncharacterized protein LOC105368003 n=1 Tax=Ceratosolen solmsi marchali TaxID=326594 RepID=A0AAJ6YVG5_9HYME|nr:PREDICTED: uncharacterized protein LOC105368003 [Ceratosolen solmsi marchali]